MALAGIYIVLAFVQIELLLKSKIKQRITSLYSGVMLMITTTWFVMACYIYASQIIEEAYDMSGQEAEYCSSANIASVALSAIQIIGSDALLVSLIALGWVMHLTIIIQIYRTYVIWDRNRMAIALPFITSLAFVGVAIAGNLSCTSVATSSAIMHRLVVAYYTFPVISNASCTIAICGKIFLHQQTLRKSNITSQTNYTLMMSVMAESGVFYALAGIVNIAFVVKNHPFQVVTNAIFTSLVYITPAQIILRIALGVDLKSWMAHDHSTKGSSIAIAVQNAPKRWCYGQSHLISIPALLNVSNTGMFHSVAKEDPLVIDIKQVTTTEVFYESS
jgi:hypothetical protein